MSRALLWLFSLLPMSAAYGAETAAALSPQDLAYGIPIKTPEPASAYRVALPIDVYRKAAYEDLRDLRVFNAKGEVVPYELGQPPPEPVAGSAGLSIPLFPLRADSRAALDGVNVTIESHGAVVDVKTGTRAAEPGAITSYVLDARELTLPVRALQIHWQDGAADYSGNLRIESSEELASWHTMRADAPVINLHTTQAQLVQNRLEVPATKAKFWRLTWVGKAAPFELVSVTADTTPERTEVEHSILVIAGSPLDEKRHEFAFDLGARPPVSQVNIELPEPNSVASIQLLSRKNPADPWRPIAHGEFYRVRNADVERRNGPLAIPTNHDRYWLARLDQPEGAIGATPPKLVALWNAEDVVFFARGDGPFLLAYGSAAAEAANAPLAALLKAETVVRADAGAPQALGGAERLRAPPSAFPWKKAALWSVLGAAVSLLAWMAYQLSQQLGTRPRGPQS